MTFNQLPLLEPFQSLIYLFISDFFHLPRQFLLWQIESGESRSAVLSGAVIHSAGRFISGQAASSISAVP